MALMNGDTVHILRLLKTTDRRCVRVENTREKHKKTTKNKKVKKIKKNLKKSGKMLDKYFEIDYYIQAL